MMISKIAAHIGGAFQKRTGLRSAAQCAAIGGAALMAFAPAAHAVVTVSPASNVAIPVTTAGIYINVVTGALGTSSAGNVGWDVNPWGTGSLFVYGNTGGGTVSTAATSGAVVALTAGTVVGPASTFATSPSAATAANGWVLNGNNYFGFSFVNEGNGLVHYGYGTISVSSAFNAAPRSVVSLFYESQPGVAITVAPVPEPSTWALMFGGLAAVGAFARRRRANSAA